MGKLSFSDLGPLHSIDAEVREVSIPIGDMTPGIHTTPDVFFELTDQGEVLWVVSRRCDHMGGKLCLEQGSRKARCPSHGWELDFTNMNYTNVDACKTPMDFRVENGILSFAHKQKGLAMPEWDKVPTPVTLRFISHASIMLKIGDFRFITDPWYLGPCLCTGWWHSNPPKADAIDLLQSASLVYFSHNHGDHLQEETLKHLDPNTPIITPDFESRSTESVLLEWGFKDVTACKLNQAFRIEGTNIQFSILKSGDFRDDSGLYITAGDFSALTTVDSNQLNKCILPQNPDVLLTSFAGGTSAYPICFDNIDWDYKVAQIDKIKEGEVVGVLDHVEAAKPKYYIPYAGYLRESADRDIFYRTHNKKNGPDDIIARVDKLSLDVTCVNPLEYDLLEFLSGEIVEKSAVQEKPLYESNDAYTQPYIAQMKETYADRGVSDLQTYFTNSRWQGNLHLFLLPAADDFEPLGSGVFVDFTQETPKVKIMTADELKASYKTHSQDKELGINKLYMRVRSECLYYVICDMRPWEDFFLGMQCMIHRTPDRYNSDFWFYFTNVYIAGNPDITPLRTQAN
jgi:CMP-N-acetylneuraminate monooxygenase